MALAIAGMLFSPACNDDDNNVDVVAPNDGGRGDGGTGTRDGGGRDGGAALQSDGQIAAVVATANAGEIAQGRLALTKAQAPEVVAFAQMMVTEHTAAAQQQAQLLAAQGITPEENEVSTSLKAESDQIVQRLNNTAAGPAFDAAYMESQVAVHQKVLDLLQNELIPNTQNPAFAEQLQGVADTVQKHLEEAQDILGTLESDGGTAGADGGTTGTDGGTAGADGGTTGADGGTTGRGDGGVTGTQDSGTGTTGGGGGTTGSGGTGTTGGGPGYNGPR